MALKPWLRATAISFSPAQTKVILLHGVCCQMSNGITNPVGAPVRDRIFGVPSGMYVLMSTNLSYMNTGKQIEFSVLDSNDKDSITSSVILNLAHIFFRLSFTTRQRFHSSNVSLLLNAFAIRVAFAKVHCNVALINDTSLCPSLHTLQ